MATSLNFHPVSMCDRIKNAESASELTDLMTEGAAFEFASDKTRQRWIKAANLRKKELSKPEAKPESQPVGKTHKNQPKKRKG